MSALVQSLLDQAKINAETIQAKDLKIQGLSLELAHLWQIRYGAKNEALSRVTFIHLLMCETAQTEIDFTDTLNVRSLSPCLF